MKRINFLLTNPRIGEKIWPAIGELTRDFEVKVFCVGEMSDETPWYGSSDPRPDIYHHASEQRSYRVLDLRLGETT